MATTTTTTDGGAALSGAALLRLFQLSSAALPIGAFAYSQGLEQAVALGDVKCRRTALDWISGVLEWSVLRLDVPVLARLHRACRDQDAAATRRWNDYLFASRGSAELRAEERQVGSALARLLSREGVAAATPWVSDPRATLASANAVASVTRESSRASAEPTWRSSARSSALPRAKVWRQRRRG